jgi:hypothetical protein
VAEPYWELEQRLRPRPIPCLPLGPATGRRDTMSGARRVPVIRLCLDQVRKDIARLAG